MLRLLIQVCGSFLSRAHAAPTPEASVLTNDPVALPLWEEHKQKLRERTRRRMTSVSCYDEVTKVRGDKTAADPFKMKR